MNLELNKKAQKIAENLAVKNLFDFSLRNPLNLDVEMLKLVMNQCNFNNKITKKIKGWAEKGLLAPSTVSFEQCSSEFTGKFKTKLIDGESCLDLTGGFGVDTFFLAQEFKNVIYNERNSALFEIVKENFKLLDISNVQFENKDALDLLKNENVNFDAIFLDPARRDLTNKKQIKIEDCEPNVLEILPRLFEISSKILIKYSPLLDLKLAIRQFPNLQKIVVLAEKNEVKEVLLLIHKNLNAETIIITANQKSETEMQHFNFLYSEEEQKTLQFGIEKEYLYEPNAAIMKAGAFKMLAYTFNIIKISANSHLYTSQTLIDNFPGKVYKIKAQVRYDKKVILENIQNAQANIVCRNFGKKPEEVKKELKISDGGNQFIYCTENQHKEKIVFICDKI